MHGNGNPRDLRRFLRLTQTEFAAVFGVHSMTVSRWERGELEPTAWQAALFEYLDRVQITRNLPRVLVTNGPLPVFVELVLTSSGMLGAAQAAYDLLQDAHDNNWRLSGHDARTVLAELRSVLESGSWGVPVVTSDTQTGQQGTPVPCTPPCLPAAATAATSPAGFSPRPPTPAGVSSPPPTDVSNHQPAEPCAHLGISGESLHARYALHDWIERHGCAFCVGLCGGRCDVDPAPAVPFPAPPVHAAGSGWHWCPQTGLSRVTRCDYCGPALGCIHWLNKAMDQPHHGHPPDWADTAPLENGEDAAGAPLDPAPPAPAVQDRNPTDQRPLRWCPQHGHETLGQCGSCGSRLGCVHWAEMKLRSHVGGGVIHSSVIGRGLGPNVEALEAFGTCSTCGAGAAEYIQCLRSDCGALR